MELKYIEIKEDAMDMYESLHINAGYSIKDTFYAFLHDYETHDQFNIAEEISIYVSFYTVLIENNLNTQFLEKNTFQLIDNNELSKIFNDSDLVDLQQDVDILKSNNKPA